MSEIEVIRLQNPAALTIPAVADLLSRALQKTQRVAPEDINEMAPDVLRIVMDPNGFVFLGTEDAEFKFVAIGFLPSTKLFPHATVVSFYSEGSRALRDLGKKKLLDYIRSAGYNAWAVNGTGRSDKAWLRVFEQPGLKITRVGTVFDMDPFAED